MRLVMAYESKYDSDNFKPPAPIIRCSVSNPASPLKTEPVTVIGLVDSGAGITCIPLEVIRELDLKPVDVRTIYAYDGTGERKVIYSAGVHLPTSESPIIRVVGTEDDHALIGRDILNKWKLILNGPQEQLIVE
ncbi:pepsin/retropepsin-like aspartic protease family protein [Candidatus Hakubella thermalkaliphila]|nr:hypothetical protein [Candidatus Hakubella thermalkaliphila]